MIDGFSVASVLQVALFVLAVVLVALAVATAGARTFRDLVSTRRAAREERLRPILMGIVSDDEFDLSPLDGLDARDRRVVEWITWQLLSKVRGSARDELVHWLVLQGAVERARQRTYRRSPVVRARAAEQLGAAAVASTYPDLVRLLSDKHPDVRTVAARALGKLGDARAVPDLLALLDARLGVPAGIVSMALVHIGPVAVDPLIDGLGSRSAGVRRVCADLLGLHGAIKATRWLNLLAEHDDHTDVRVRAVSALGRIGNPQSLEALRRSLSPVGPSEVRVAAAQSLGLIGGTEALGALQAAIVDGDPNVRRVAAEALGHLGEPGLDVLRVVAANGGPGCRAAENQLVRRRLRNDNVRTRRRGRLARPGVA